MIVALAVTAALAAGEPALAPDTYERLGTAGIVAVILSAVIAWLLRDRTKERADKERIIAQRDALFEKLVDSERQNSSSLAAVAPILEAVMHELRHAREHV